MTPDERQLLSGLFDRIRSNGSNQQRDRDAETFISDAVRQQPYAPYLLSQTVIVQEQALKAANERLQQLEAKVQSLESQQGQQSQGGQSGGSEGFLGGLGRSIFGGGSSQSQEPSRSAPPAYAPQGQYGQNQPQYAQPQGGPWGGAAQQPAAQGGGGGGFLKGALGMAAGVAGGALLGNAVSGLFHGSNNPFGIASGMGGLGGGFGGGAGGETVINNYYEGDGPGNGGGYDQAADSDQGGFDNAADFGDDGGFDGGGSDDSYNV